MVKGVGIFVSGAVTGAVVTYILMKNQQVKLEKSTQEEINAVKLEYKSAVKPNVEETEDEDGDVDENSTDDDEDDRVDTYNYAARSEKLRKANRARAEEKKIYRSVKNQDYLDDMLDDEDEDEEEDNDYDDFDDDLESDHASDRRGGLEDFDHPIEGPSNRPYSIDSSTFANTNNHYDKLTLIWYSVDDILADEDNERIIDDAIVGSNWRAQVGKYEPDVAYIRNDGISVDYEIIKEDLSYFKDAL